MPVLSSYSDFLKATKVAKITGLREILNDAVKNTYAMTEMLKGRGEEEVLQAGQSIKDDIQLSAAGSFQFYSPNPEFNPTDDDVLTEVSVGWRFATTFYGYSDETISLNKGTNEDVYVDLKYKYEQSQRTDMMNGMEDALWAVPVTAGMESGTGDSPPAYSIPALVNENTSVYAWPGWTTVESVNPSTEERWRNQKSVYDSTNVADEDTGIIAAFDEMFLKVKFESPDSSEEYFENDRLRMMKIFTNRDGIKKYKRLLRSANDRLISPQDPAYNSPVYAGIPMKYIAALDTAALEMVSNVATGIAYPEGKPRYFWLNFKFLFPIWHTQGYMEQVGPVPGGINQPFSHAVYYRTWYNLFCRSRQRQGIVAPM